jgi:hypothetical protein
MPCRRRSEAWRNFGDARPTSSLHTIRLLTHHDFAPHGNAILTPPCRTHGPSTPLGTGTRMEGQEWGWG